MFRHDHLLRQNIKGNSSPQWGRWYNMLSGYMKLHSIHTSKDTWCQRLRVMAWHHKIGERDKCDTSACTCGIAWFILKDADIYDCRRLQVVLHTLTTEIPPRNDKENYNINSPLKWHHNFHNEIWLTNWFFLIKDQVLHRNCVYSDV